MGVVGVVRRRWCRYQAPYTFAAPRRGGVEVVSKIRVESATETSRARGLRVVHSIYYYYYRQLLLKVQPPS